MPAEVVRIDTGCDPRCRSVFIARSGDIMVSLGGETGTMTEIMMAYAMGKAVYALTGTGLSSDRLAQAFPEKLDSRAWGRSITTIIPKSWARIYVGDITVRRFSDEPCFS